MGGGFGNLVFGAINYQLYHFFGKKCNAFQFWESLKSSIVLAFVSVAPNDSIFILIFKFITKC